MRRLLPLGVSACLVATCAAPGGPAAGSADSPMARGEQLFARHCAVCHGATGDADTAVAGFLLPRPAAFRHGLFKLVSTTNGMPTEDDLVAMLRRGMPGSTMMAFDWLPEADLRELAREVRRLAIDSRATSLERTGLAIGRPLSAAEARAAAERQLQPGAPVDTGVPQVATAANTAAGEDLYRRHCSGCHGLDGRGLPVPGDWPTSEGWLWPRDFTAGFLRGGAGHHDLALRVRAGMPGAHMPPAALTTAETEALVTYVRGLIPETASDHHAQWRRTLRIAQVASLPGDDAATAALDAVRLPVAPLWWRAEAVFEVWLRAAHDGERVLLQLEWADASRDDRVHPGVSIGDGTAIQFTRRDDPPLFAMGSPQDPVNIWRWHCFDPKETAGMVDLFAGATHAGIDVPIGEFQPRPRTESIAVGGVHAAREETTSGLPLDVTSRWRDGRWIVTFRRTLRARSSREVDLVPGEPALFALAVWNGSIDSSAASKSITTWHVLQLQR